MQKPSKEEKKAEQKRLEDLKVKVEASKEHDKIGKEGSKEEKPKTLNESRWESSNTFIQYLLEDSSDMKITLYGYINRPWWKRFLGIK